MLWTIERIERSRPPGAGCIEHDNQRLCAPGPGAADGRVEEADGNRRDGAVDLEQRHRRRGDGG
jgi:hypothetical protein